MCEVVPVVGTVQPILLHLSKLETTKTRRVKFLKKKMTTIMTMKVAKVAVAAKVTMTMMKLAID